MTLTLKKTNNYREAVASFLTELTVTRTFPLYFLLVLVIYVVIYLPLPLQGKMYIYRDIGTDTFDSYWPMYAFIRDYFHDFQFDGWSFQHGLGSSVIAAAPWIFDPFNLFIIPFSKANLDLGIFLAATAKVFTLAVLAYSYLARIGYRGIPLIASSIAYTFCGYFIGWGQHYQFATMFVLFTLVLYCFEGWIQSFRWPGLILSIALLAAFWPYTLYMTLVFLTVYYLFRYVQLRFPWSNFLPRSISTAGLILWGIALGAVFFLPQMYVLTQSARVNAQVLPSLLWSTRNEYYTIFLRMFSNGLLGVNDFQGYVNYYEAPFFYAGILTIILVPRLFLNDVRKKTYVWILLVCGFLLVFPGFAKPVFSAFSSDSYRWTFVLVPVFVTALAEAITVLVNNSYKWIYGAGIGLAGAAGIATLLFNRSADPDLLGLSVPVSAAIVMISAVLYGLVLFRSQKPLAPYLLLSIFVFETALTGFISVNWRNTVATTHEKYAPYFDPSTNKALAKIFSNDQTFFRINKNYHEFYLTDALFQDFYGEKQYSSVTPGYIRDMEELFGLTEPRSNHLTGFSGKQALRDITAVRYMLTPQKHSYAGYEYLAQVDNVHIFRNKNASSLGIVYKNYITLENFKKLDLASRQHLLYDAAVVPSESEEILLNLNEVETPLLYRLSEISLDEDFKKNKAKILENDFPHHLQLNLKGVESYLIIKFIEPANTSLDIQFTITSPLSSAGKVFFKTPESDYNHNDATAFTLQPGTHNYYVTVPVLGVDAIRLSIAHVAGTFSIDNVAVFKRDDERIAKQTSLLSSGIQIDTFSNDYIRATTNLGQGSLVYFSIPFDEGWKIYVDGVLSEKIQANIAFTGVYVGPGNHRVELTYSIPWLRAGAVTSVFAFLLLFIFWAKSKQSF